MTERLLFFLLCEGTSDEPLAEHIQTLVSRRGFTEVLGIPRSGGGSVRDKLATLRDSGATFDFVAVHRDADARDDTDRIAEVRGALAETGLLGCPVVPVQMTESWLLVSEEAIRAAVGRPSGSDPLGLPKRSEIERTHDAKGVLKGAVLAAAGGRGRRYKRAVREWSTHRRVLLERLDVDGPVRKLKSWQRLVDDLDRVVDEVLEERERQASSD